MKNKLARMMGLVLALVAASVLAEVPGTISYQGYLTDNAGGAVDGSQSVTFKLYDDAATELWTETLSVIVTNGVFEATLGAQTALPDPLIEGASLGITFGANTEMTPRQQLNSSPFAIHAKTTEKDTLNSLNCSADQIAQWSGSAWVCADSAAGGGIQSITTGAGLTSSGTETVDISIAAGALTASQIGSSQVVKGLNIGGNVLTDTVTITQGTGISFSPAGNTVAINSTLTGPSAIATTIGLTGGGNSGTVTLGIADGGVASTNIAADQVVKSITMDGVALRDNFSIVAGAGVSIANLNGEVTIAADTALPANVVTTDTAQTITGVKKFDEPLNLSGLTGDVSVGALGDFERLDIFGEIDMQSHTTGATFFEVFSDDQNNVRMRSGGDIFFGDDVILQNPSGTSKYDLTADNIEAEQVNSEGTRVYGGRSGFYSSVITGSDFGGSIEYNANGLRISTSAGTDTVTISDNMYVGDNLEVDDNLDVTGVASKPGGGQWAALSDRRLKRNIQPMNATSALEKIGMLVPVTFEWINPNEHGGVSQESGFIAQEIEIVFPSWVKEAKPKGKDAGLVTGSVKTINLPNEFNAYLVSAIQELAAQNKMLKNIVCQDHAEKELCQQ